MSVSREPVTSSRLRGGRVVGVAGDVIALGSAGNRPAPSSEAVRSRKAAILASGALLAVQGSPRRPS